MGVCVCVCVCPCVDACMCVTSVKQLSLLLKACLVFQEVCNMCVTLQTTVMAILDKMIEPLQLEEKPGSHKVFYNILDGDQHGRDPNCTNFDSSKKSCLHRIAESDSKVIINFYYSISLI